MIRPVVHNCFRLPVRQRRTGSWFLFCLAAVLHASLLFAGNFYAGITPATVPWTNGIVPYEFTNTLTLAQQQTYLAGLREWELAANVKFVPHTNQARYILFTYDLNGPDNVSIGYSPQVVAVASLSRAQVCHEMGHSFGFNHENIRVDQTNYLTVVTNNISPPSNLSFFNVDSTTLTNGPYDFESVMHLGNNFSSTSPATLFTQLAKPAYVKFQPRMGNLCLSKGDRAALSYLYGPPVVPLTNVVTTTADFGSGSLRAALYYAADHPGAIIRFNIPTSDAGYSNGVFTLHLSGYLPPLVTDATVIDGSTQPGFSGKPLIIVDGSQMIPEAYSPGTVTGLLIYAANCQVKNLSFQNFNWNGLTLRYAYATNNIISGCWLGLDFTGTNAAPNALQGILIYDGASGNFIGGTNTLARNVISGNTQYGVLISGTNTTSNVVLGNYLGTDASGSRAVANSAGGVYLAVGAHGNTVGGTNAATRNVISGNTSAGVWLIGPNVFNNFVQGNFIGLNASGTAALPNSIWGVRIVATAQSNLISGNVVSGNGSEGVSLSDAGTKANTVQGNFIGTDSTGSNAVPNGFAGATIYAGATSNLIGGTSASARNVISGNNTYGVVIANAGTSGNLIQGNYIGLGSNGVSAVANYDGVLFSDSATNNTLGGTNAGAANFISGNAYRGVLIADPGTSGNFVQGNFIGPDRTGTNGLGNYNNVQLQNSASGNFIGGVNAGAGNVIAFANGTGVILYQTTSTNNVIRGNSIFSNFYLGIDLNGDGVTLNHSGFLAGPNDLQNFPVITNAYASGSATIVAGNFSSTANRSFFIDVYRSLNPDFTGYGEGQFYAGSVSVTTDVAGSARFSLTNTTANYAGQYFTATATAASGDTSEFSLAVLATNAPAASAIFNGPYLASGNGFSFTLNLQTNFSYRIQAATNLAQSPIVWLDLTNFTATNIVFNFTDRTATNFRARFYRVKSP